MRTHQGITEDHLRGLPGLSRSAASGLVERQPATVREALLIPGVGRRTTRRLLALGLLQDPEGMQSDAPPSKRTLQPRSDFGIRPRPVKCPWAFVPRFRRGGMGWRSQPAVQRVREAVAEIVREARRDPATAAEGAVLFLEKVAPALESVDSSSGAIGTAVNRAIATLVPLVAAAPAERKTREAWLERLWEAMTADEIPYLECLGESWGELCASAEVASLWADRLKPIVELSWNPDPSLRGYFKGTSACLSSLLAAGRHDELLELLEKSPRASWYDRQFGFRALVAMGRKTEALRYAETCRGRYDNPLAISRDCEAVLLSSNLAEEAYRRYGYEANLGTTHLATYRAVARKYPHKKPAEILADLVAETPGDEGKWFAAAKEAGLYQEAIALAERSPCDPRTLTRAARDYGTTNPAFAVKAGVCALHWIAQGYGFEITSADVWDAYRSTLRAAENAGGRDEALGLIRSIAQTESIASSFLAQVLGQELDPS
jgi:hypothetical protein